MSICVIMYHWKASMIWPCAIFFQKNLMKKYDQHIAKYYMTNHCYGLSVKGDLLWYSVLCTVESLCLLYLFLYLDFYVLGTSFVDLLCFSVLCLLCICMRLFVFALCSPALKGLTSWPSFALSSCEFVTLPLVSWVRCGSWLYRFLIFASLLTFMQTKYLCVLIHIWTKVVGAIKPA